MRLSKKNKILFSSIATLLAISFCLLSVAIFFNFKNKDSSQVKADVTTYSFDDKIKYTFTDNDPNNQNSTNTSIAANGIDGNVLPGETYNNTQVFTINSRDGWILFAISCSRFDYNGKTVKLTADIDCGGAYIVPVGHSADNFDYYNKQYYWGGFAGLSKYFSNFNGTFDGQGHALTNFQLRCARYDTQDRPACGLFLQLGPNAKIQNFKVQDAIYNIMPNEYGSDWNIFIVGGIAGYADVGSQISKCWVKNVSVLLYDRISSVIWPEANRSIGGILGATSGTKSNDMKVYVTDCIVEDFKLFREFDGPNGEIPLSTSGGDLRTGLLDLYGICFEGASDIGATDTWISITNCLVRNLEIHNLTQFLYHIRHILFEDESPCTDYTEMHDYLTGSGNTLTNEIKMFYINRCKCDKIENSETSDGYYNEVDNGRYKSYFYKYSFGNVGASNCRAVAGEPSGWNLTGNNATWYYNIGYNSGWPMLRVFMSFQEFKFDTKGDGGYNVSEFVPKQMYSEDKDFVAEVVTNISDHIRDNSLTIMGRSVQAINGAGKFQYWQKINDYQYKAVFSFVNSTIYFDVDQDDNSDYEISVAFTPEYLDQVDAQKASEFDEIFNLYLDWINKGQKDNTNKYLVQTSILSDSSINSFHNSLNSNDKITCTLENDDYVLGRHATFTINKIEKNSLVLVNSVELLSEERSGRYLVGTTGIKSCGTAGYASLSNQSVVINPQDVVTQPEVPDSTDIYYYQSVVEYLDFSIDFKWDNNAGTLTSIKTNYLNIKELYNQVVNNLRVFNMSLTGEFYYDRNNNCYYYGYKPNSKNVSYIGDSLVIASGYYLSDFGRWKDVGSHNGWINCISADNEWMPNSGESMTPRDYTFELERLKKLYFYTDGDTNSKYPNYLQFLSSEYSNKVGEFILNYLEKPSFTIHSDYVNNSIITAQKSGHKFINWEFVKTESGCDYYKAIFKLQTYTIVFYKTQIANSGYYSKCYVEQNNTKTEFSDRVEITASYKSTISVSVDYSTNTYIYTVKNQDKTVVAKISYVLGSSATDEEWKYTIERFNLPVAENGNVYDANVTDESEYIRDNNISVTLCMEANEDGTDPVVNITPSFKLKTYEIKGS